MAKPRHLALGITTRRALRRGDSVCKRRLTAQMAQQLGQPHRLHRRQIGIEPAKGKRRGFGQCAAVHHRCETRIAGGVQPIARRDHQDRREAARRCGMRPVVPRADRHAGGARDRVGAHQPLRVAGVKPLRRGWVERRQPLAKKRAAEFSMERRSLVADRIGNFRKWRQPVPQRVKIEPGAADDDRQPPGCGGGCNFGERQGAPAPTEPRSAASRKPYSRCGARACTAASGRAVRTSRSR